MCCMWCVLVVWEPFQLVWGRKGMADDQGFDSSVFKRRGRKIFHGLIFTCAACSGCDGDLAGRGLTGGASMGCLVGN